MEIPWIIGCGVAVLVCIASSFIVKRRLDRWAEGMIISFGMSVAARRLNNGGAAANPKETLSARVRVPVGAVE
jgi:hypothetical protein